MSDGDDLGTPLQVLPVIAGGGVRDDAGTAEAQGCSDGCCGTDTDGEKAAAVSGSSCSDSCCDTEATEPAAAAVTAAEVDSDERLERTVVRVTGMDCASCAATIEKRVGAMDGVRSATVNFAAGRLDAQHVKGVELVAIESAIERAGYGIERPDGADRAPFWSQPKVQLTVAGLILFAFAAILSLSGAADWVTTSAYALATLIGGMPIYRIAVQSARAKVADVNVLMTIAVIGAAAIGAWGEAALVVILFSVSNALQVYAVGRTQTAVRALARLAPGEAMVRRGGAEVMVPVDEIAVGETVVVRPGERIAVDGEIADGLSALDESPVTGESTPAEKGRGDDVFSGSLNGPGGLLVRVTKAAGDSTLQRITRMVEEAQGTKAPIEQYVERFARIYTPLVMVAAVLVAAVPPLLGGDTSTWIYRALVLLIVSCPCALVISTPVSVVSGIGAASRRGILVKGGQALEAAGKLRTLFFDKTGTLTEGRPVVERVITITGEKAEALELAAALERRSEHPLAHAILTAAGEIALPEVTDFRSVPGRGAEGEIAGRRLRVGSPRLFEERGIDLSQIAAEMNAVDEAGETPVILGDDAGVIAVFGLADAIRPDAAAALRELRELGVERLVMLTGDAEAPARRIAGQLGIEYRARLLPEDKVEAVEQLALDHGTVGMVGDGINDAPALAAADVSFAMGAAGTDVALEAADVALMADDLSKLSEAVRLSRAAERTIKQNIFVSILFNSAFTILAPFGIIPLWLAVLEDAITSTGVTANSLRLFGVKERQSDEPAPKPRQAAVTASAASR